MLKFSANLSLLFTERPLIERFATARAAGFSAVEIQFPYELSTADIKAELQAHHLELVLINVPTGDLMQGGDGFAGVPGRQAEFRSACQQAMDYAQALDVKRINILSGRQPEGLTREECLATLGENLHHAAHYFDKAGITPLTEAINIFDMPRFLVHSLVHMRELCDEIKPLKMQFDCYHLSRMGRDILPALRGNLQDIAHIQFADNPGRHEPGTGQIDYAPIFSLLRDSDYPGWCGAEYHPSKKTEDTLAWLQHFAQTSIPSAH
ncbi:MAG: hydroxypyruvate isomerase family protein [Moraxellaceae bacterium]